MSLLSKRPHNPFGPKNHPAPQNSGNGKPETGNASELTRNQKLETRNLYETLHSHWGPQYWWPAQSRFQVIVGAILTQNTNWGNVEKAIASLRRARALSPAAIRRLPVAELEQLIRSSGYYRQKALRLKAFVAMLHRDFGGSLHRMFATPTMALRQKLLAVNGIGPETADSILLYAGGHPIFVVDAYTRRILERHAILPDAARAAYDTIRTLIESALTSADEPSPSNRETGNGKPETVFRETGNRKPETPFLETRNQKLETPTWNPRHPASRMSRADRTPLAQLYNDFHALIVRAGNQHCRKSPSCAGCPLEPLLPKLP